MKKALIIGIHGQDGSFLKEKLLDSGYDVMGIVREIKLESRIDPVKIITGDLTDKNLVDGIVSDYRPTHIYNFAGVSNVLNPYENWDTVFDQNCKIPHNFLESILRIDNKIRFFQSSSSLMFGRSKDISIKEESRLEPIYPYGISKSYSHLMVKEYREAFGIFCVSGIFFNHESERRGRNFLTQKIISGIKEIIKGNSTHIKVGNIDALKDISYAGDFMDAVKLIMEESEPNDYVLGSGKLVSIRDFIQKAFAYFDLDYKKYIIEDRSLLRLNNPETLVANPEKIRLRLGWEHKKDLDDIIQLMVK